MDKDKGAAFLDERMEKRPRLDGPKAHGAAVERLWNKGLAPGDRTGWVNVDRHYTVAPGQLTIVTGWPGSGKSEFVDAMLVNLSRQGWKFVVFSPENQPVELHIAKLLEKLSGKPFGHGPTPRLSLEEVAEFTDELDQSFGFMEAPGEDSITAADVIEAAAPFLQKFGEGTKRGLVIDPWNELEHWRPSNLSETEYISKTLSTVRNWARRNGVHVFLVAHPQKVRREEGKLPVPRPDMISGSIHWWNKADACITVYRDFEHPDSTLVEIHVQKVRFKHIGRPGLVTLHYDRICGRYGVQQPQLEIVK